MFYALTLNDGSFLYRRKLYKKPRVTPKRVQGGLPYCVIETSVYRKKINWGETGRICGSFKNRLLLPDNVERPENFPEADCESFRKLIFANTALEIIRKLNFDNKKISMCIEDKNGDAAGKLSSFVPLIGSIFVKTQRPDLYIPEIKRAMEEYGARIRFTQKETGDIVLNLDREICCFNSLSKKADIKAGESIKLPFCYSSICPKDIKRVNFSAFLYNFSKVSSLNSLYFEDVIIDTQKVKIKEASQTLKRLCY